ncbi:MULTISPECIES: hypothetical protein [Streptomycetaceae]|uniref:hypothetical protein n=1 Tax=Streptomycetaceae TaxID=2062 RepID=UPI0030092046
MTAPTTAALTPTEVLRAAAAVIRARGYFQPLTRQWEPEVPTAMDVERYLYGRAPVERGDRRRFDAQAEAAAQLAPAVLEWCARGEEGSDYRTALARLARADHVGERDIPLLCSAVHAYQREQRRAAATAERAADAAHSRHQGATGERIAITATVAVVVALTPRRFGYHEQPRHLVKLRDADHNVYVWEATTTNLPTRGARVHVTGTVASHGRYHGTPQTNLTRCRWKIAQD